MAKKTKAADLSIEEKLEQALVVTGYEPYKIPDNWCWVKMNSISNFERGITFPASAKEKEKSFANIPCLRTANVQETLDISDLIYVDKTYMKNNPAKLVKKKDILMSIANSKELVGKTSLISSFTGSMTFGGFVMAIRSKIVADFLFYYLRNEFYSGRFIGDSTQTTNIANINSTMLGHIETPVPPLPEQQRIVERIESLFSKLDEAKEKAQEVINSLETRKAAILHKAFSGELTAKWREENGVGIESWKRKTLGEVCNSIFDGDHMPPPKSKNGIPFLVISNVNDGYLSFENTRFVPQEYYDAITDTRKPEKGDVLYTLVGSFGIPVVVDTNAPFCFQRHMALLKPKSINTYFLWYLLQSQEMYQKASSIAKGVAQLTVPIKGLRLMDFNCPSEEEQIEIVRILDSLLEKEDTSKDNAESIIDKIETMKKAILARAFRGELGTNDPEEESAVELLKQILSGE